MNSNKRSNKVKNGILIAVVIAFLISIIGGTYAKYISSGTTTTDGEIAKWHIELGGQDISSETKTIDVSLTADEESNENTTSGKLAPGQVLSGTFTVDPTGSEAAVDYLLTIGSIQASGGTWSEGSKLSLSKVTALLEDDEQETELTIAENETIYFENLDNVINEKNVTFKVYVIWDNSNDANNEADTANGIEVQQITVPITVVARQHIEEFFTVTFMAGDTIVSSATVGEGNTVAEPTTPDEEGYVFDNWYSDPEMTTVYDFASPVNGDTTIYAKMDKLCTVTFKDGENTLSTETVAKGQKVSVPTTPEKAQCTFDNWYSDAELTTLFDFNAAITGDTIIYSKWIDSLSELERNLGYVGNTNSSDLQVGDRINYYYDATKSPIQCVVLYKDVAHGIQAVSKGGLKEITLGAKAGTEDPKIPSSLASSSDFEKAKWSYNNAVSTLNSYAMEYVPENGMALDGRCVGSNPLIGQKNKAEENEMITASNDPYGSARSFMTSNGLYNSFKLGDTTMTDNEYYNEDFNQLKSLNIQRISSSVNYYWLASRYSQCRKSTTSLFVLSVYKEVSASQICGVGSAGGRDGYAPTRYLRPVFQIKENIPVEKLN